MQQLLKLLGSLSVLGNPIGLFNNISTGVTDLIQLPVDGFMKGPLEGGLGVVQGAGSLV
jgi:vacuolar protein sorting-associated protein 13A/C